MPKFFKKQKKDIPEPKVNSSTDDVSQSNRREHLRVQTGLHAILRLNEQKYSAKIVDISAGGVKLTSEQALPVDEIMTVEFTLPANKSGTIDTSAVGRTETRLMVACKVVHAAAEGEKENTYGVKFEAVNEVDLKRISTFVVDTQISSRFAQ